jgi:hypothetical protein
MRYRPQRARRTTVNQTIRSTEALIAAIDLELTKTPSNLRLLEKRATFTALLLRAIAQAEALTPRRR